MRLLEPVESFTALGQHRGDLVIVQGYDPHLVKKAGGLTQANMREVTRCRVELRRHGTVKVLIAECVKIYAQGFVDGYQTSLERMS